MTQAAYRLPWLSERGEPREVGDQEGHVELGHGKALAGHRGHA
jgi:hypothetical protein